MMQIFVKVIEETIALTGQLYKVADIKQQIEEIEGIPVGYQRLIFEGKVLEDGRELSYYKVRDESTLHLTMDLEGGWAPPHLRYLAEKHLLYKMICRKCYGRLPPNATRCRKAKCGRTADIRPKKTLFYRKQVFKLSKQYENQLKL